MKKLCFLLVCGVLMANEWKIQDDPYYKHKKSQFEALANVDRYDTVMLGDSITDEARWDELLNSSTIQNRGISGDTTSGVLDRLDSTNKNIKKVFIMVGINDIMRGKNVDEALAIMKFTPKASSPILEKLLKSAIANAENNHDMSHEKLYISEIYANQGPTLKRIRPAAKGSAVRIRKRTSHITIVLKEKEA